jgi:hypothetical protein
MAQQQQRLVWAAAGEHEETAEVGVPSGGSVRVLQEASEWHLQRRLPGDPTWRPVSRHPSRESARQAAEELALMAAAAAATGLTFEELQAQRADSERSRARVSGHQYGDYPWDRWRRRSIAAGLAEDLAQLGRDVMREAAQHGWDEDLCQEMGWADEGTAMLELALRDPDSARSRWRHLLQTDGLRFAPEV